MIGRLLFAGSLVVGLTACGGAAPDTESAAETAAETPPPAETPAPASDFADANAGGPDFWAVTTSDGGALELRAEPSAEAAVRASVEAGQVVRNLGCQGEGADRWCRVGTLADESVDGWARGANLQESAPPAAAGEGRVLQERSGADVPQVYRRGTGEYEVGWEGGCTVLLDTHGALMQSGSSCSETQRTRSVEIVGGLSGG